MKKKVLLMGKSGSGKTSMRSIIFANYIARDTRRLGATIDVEHSHVRFLGQESFMDGYIASQQDQVFVNVEILIYVFDVESREFEKDLQSYQTMIEALVHHSRDAKVFCLIHKMDLIQLEQRAKVFETKSNELIKFSNPINPTIFATSIWDETLYKAWSSIVYSLIPNVHLLENSLQRLCTICEASDIILFEKTTFLVISHTKGVTYSDSHRFEKVSNIIKQFKLSCSKSQASFQTMEIRNPNMSIFVQPLTPNTYILVVLSNASIQSAIPIMNIQLSRKHFEEIEQQT
ncbi:Gtr1/RagA G protein conserved region-domain-containing protein [Globomyces pollinis-pini]|nr:Gtr1/RagA G protein conserved region-domain-containing protein [Globomyces pollinis-pini]